MFLRFFLTMSFYVVLARFMYTEAVTYVPESRAYLDSAIEFLSIPPSTEWDKEKIIEYSDTILANIPISKAEAEELTRF